ncbi:hypothetical protein [Streptomyces sp. NPDC005148]
MAERIARPDDGKPVDIQLVVVFALGLWGRSPGEERDARTAERGEYDTKRALQSARGHVTRELISELQVEVDRRWPELEKIFGELERVIDDEVKLQEWVDQTHELEKNSNLDLYMKDASQGKGKTESRASGLFRGGVGRRRK